MTMRHCRFTIAGLLLFAGVSLLATASANDRFVPNPDGATYLMLGESLRQGEGYACQGIPHAKFPPVYPLLLAVAAEIWEAPGSGSRWPEYGMWPQKAVGIAALALTGLLLSALALRRHRPWVFLVGALPGLIAWRSIHHVNQIASEWVFSALQTAALIALTKWGEHADWRAGKACPRKIAVAYVLASGLAVLTRSAGVFLILAGVLHLWLCAGGSIGRRVRLLALPALLPLMPAALWLLRSALLPRDTLPAEMFESRGYVRWVLTPNADYTGVLSLGGVLERSLDLACRYWRAAVRLFSADTAWIGPVVSVLLCAGLLVALVGWLRRRRDPVLLCVMFTGAGYCLYTWGGDRFLIPVGFLLGGIALEALGAAIETVLRFLPTFRARPGYAGGAVILIVILGLFPWHVRRFERSRREWVSSEEEGGYRRDFRAAARWLRGNSASGDVVICEEAASMAWLSGRTVWSYPLVRDPAVIRAALRSVGARWLVHTEGREWVPRLPRDVIEGGWEGGETVWEEGPTRIVRFSSRFPPEPGRDRGVR